MAQFRILIVDDDDDLRDLLMMSIRHQYEVVLAVDGLDALNHLSITEPDIAILDIEMPLMNGLELCAAIRRHPDFQTMPVLFLSGQGSIENIKKGYGVGANLYMVKPIEPARILKNIELTIEQHRPPVRRKRYTLDQIRAFEASGSMPTIEAATAPASAYETASEAPTPAPSEPTKAAPLARLMLIDDDDDMRELMELSLKKDFEVTLARDGLDAVRKIADYQPDLLLLDLMMPGMSGFQLLQSIRRNPSLRELPVIVVSARSGQRDRDHARQLGANEFIAKPFMPLELVERVRRFTAASEFKIRPKRKTLEQIIDTEFAAVTGRQELLVLKGIHSRKHSTAEEILAEKSRKRPG